MIHTRPELVILETPELVAEAAAAAIAGTLADAIAARSVAHWATTGGSSAAPIYGVLRAAPLRDAVDWGRVRVWWGDDRFVSRDHPLSNVRPFDEVLLGRGSEGEPGVRIPVANIHPLPVDAVLAAGGGPVRAAAAYAADLRSSGPAPDSSGVPVFDLVVLGVGPDGHILSVFPGSATWADTALCVAVPAPAHVAPHVERVTMHPRLLAAARRVLVVATGAAKARVLGRAWAGENVRELPVRATFLHNATWLLDEAAAAALPRS